MLATLLVILFALICAALVLFVLLQVPRQSGLSAGLGGGGDLFGGRGVEGGLVRITSVLGGLFMLMALLLNIIQR
ncbi:preprotein translocase subunit SecG [Deinococcus maricopensis]|uniref:Protein-export membrane protein SecG n=1 Tax=Deinococcus maricopensis (strain DSM 21211 / LMG 22137 / NRRL B-23946 / LB-34) TaxID=709986 RepID=E8U9F0_DEIML|nr:preprotein translocase subunit SecG [Deinococcus maricopensis]ADV67689.1 preprotein translocase, SecG subunit [Deinococcus maricopensis DSM 21211]